MSCTRCDAVCCRLQVRLDAGDAVPAHLTDHDAHGTRVMARDEEGWCVAVDPGRMNCSIYETRPRVCRDFRLGGDECHVVRAAYARCEPVEAP